jgi:tRNA pseudouridine32 synthase/23S rRNA pseudouridine746 synthase
MYEYVRQKADERMQSRVFKKIVSADDHGNACDILSKFSGISKSRIKRAMNQGAVWHQGKTGRERRIRRATFEVRTGDRITFYYNEKILSCTAPQSHCVKDFTDYSIWFKPAGLMTQGTRYGDHCALARHAQIHFKSRREVYIIHRIDRETAGLVILAHNRKAASRFSSLLQSRKVKKCYSAWVRGDLRRFGDHGEIDSPLNGRKARTRFRFIRYDKENDQSLIDVNLITGRFHQIRRHFEIIGHPVMGDPRYGKGNKNISGLQLVAKRLLFECPFGNGPIDIQIDLDMNSIFSSPTRSTPLR